MLWQNNLYLNILLGFIIVALGASLYILRHKRESYNRIGILFLFFLIEWMVSDYGLDEQEAYMLIGLCPDFRINIYQMVRIPDFFYTAGAEIPKKYLT